MTDHQDSLIVISNIKHYNTYPPSNTHVNFVLGSTEIKTGALAASQGDGIAYLWGSLPKSHIRDKLEISLQVSIDSIVCDSLFIGVLHVRGLWRSPLNRLVGLIVCDRTSH